MKTIIIAAGGTGGHVFPAISVARKLLKNFHIQFVTDQRGLKYTEEFQKSAIVQNIRTDNRVKLYFSLIVNLLKSFGYLLKNRPVSVVGFGGYPSVPFVLAAQILRIKTFIHEQNAVMGKANKLLSKLACKSLKAFEGYGVPTRFEDLYDKFEYQPSAFPKFQILIIGGSQGSKAISENVLNSFRDLPIHMKENLEVIQQVREEDENLVKEFLQQNNIKAEVKSFFNNMDELYQKVDLVISRSGASTVFELVGFKIPCLLIPFEKSINGDQEANAACLKQRGAAFVFKEKEPLTAALVDLYEDREQLKKMSQAMRNFFVENPSEKVAQTIVSNLW